MWAPHPPERSSAVLATISSKSASICKHSDATYVDSSRNRYGGLLEPRGSKLTLLKSTFNAENFIRRLSWSVSSDFGAADS